MHKIRRKLFSQNFLHSRKLIKKLLGNSSIGKNDLVLEIGPGKGIITEQLVELSHHVLGVEIDTEWYAYLHQKFSNQQNITLYKQDILDFKLSSLPYKVFANIPFAIEGQIIRKLIDDKNPPDDCFLVIMKELAYRLAAPYKENMFSSMHKPWFNFSICYEFNRADFTPTPHVDAVLFRFTKRSQPLISIEKLNTYQAFIKLGFEYGLPIYTNLKTRYGKEESLFAIQKINKNKQTKPGELALEEWLRLYTLLLK